MSDARIASVSAIVGLLLRHFISRRLGRWLAVVGCVALVAAVAMMASAFGGIVPTKRALMWALLPLTIPAAVLPFAVAASCGRR